MSLTISQLTTICIGICGVITLGMQMYYNSLCVYNGLIRDETSKLLKDYDDIVEFEFNDISFDYEICEE